MNIALTKTQALQRLDIDIKLLDPNPDNPNEMSDAEFNMLYDNFEQTGFTDPVLVRLMPSGRYQVIGGHHRIEVAKLHEFKLVPCTVISDPEFDDDKAAFQTVRMNVIRGQMTPDKFLKMYNGLSAKYSREVLKEAFGFAEEQEFRKMVKEVEKGLPPEMKPAFQKAAKDVKTLDGLSKILNSMFSKYGSTLEYGYMALDYGGKDSIWVRISKNTHEATYAIGDLCREHGVTMDSLLGGVVQLIAQGGLQSEVLKIVAASPKVVIPEQAVELPTEDFLASLEK